MAYVNLSVCDNPCGYNETIENDHNMKWPNVYRFWFFLLFHLLRCIKRCSEKSSRYFVWRASNKQDKNDLLIISPNGMDIIPFIEQKQNTTLSLDSLAISLNSVTSIVRKRFYFYFLLLVRRTYMFCCVVCLHLCWSILCFFFLHHISDRHLIYRPLKNEIQPKNAMCVCCKSNDMTTPFYQRKNTTNTKLTANQNNTSIYLEWAFFSMWHIEF